MITQNKRKGSDPRAATCRGKLQTRRSKLNMEINKELMLRSGAENLFKATSSKKMKETVALELSFVNSNLQLLKEQLAELNSCVELYQKEGDRHSVCIPMVPLGLKETKEIDFREPFKDFILEHYSEDGADYENSIAEFMDLRQATRTPTRDLNGISLLFEYFNQLYYLERRFFPPDRNLGIFFEWYDSLTGVPSCQRTVAFEKASILFNIGALYTQIGSRQDRGSHEGLDQAVDNFLRAAGTFQYLHDNFTNAPSTDLQTETLEMLVHLMCAQARECLFEKSELVLRRKEHFCENEETATEKKSEQIELFLQLAQEAAHVSEVFRKVSEIMSQPPAPDSWVTLSHVKREHYKAISHFYASFGLLSVSHDDPSTRTLELLEFLHVVPEEDSDNFNRSRNNDEVNLSLLSASQIEKRYLGKAHLREALLLHEEAMRLNRMCRELRKKEGLQQVLSQAHDRSLKKYASIDDEDDFQEVLDAPGIAPQTQFQLSLAFPDLGRHKVSDLFTSLGPVAVFNAKHFWSVPRSLTLKKKDHQGFGFSVRGDAPVIVAGVDRKSLAQMQGMKEGDYIVGINSYDVKWLPHDDIVSLIKESENLLNLKLVSPMGIREKKTPSCDQPRTASDAPISLVSSLSADSSDSTFSSSSRQSDNIKITQISEHNSAEQESYLQTKKEQENSQSWKLFKTRK